MYWARYIFKKQIHEELLEKTATFNLKEFTLQTPPLTKHHAVIYKVAAQ